MTSTATAFNPTAHPRSDTTGQFVETAKTDPGSDLLNGDGQRFDWIPDDELLTATARIAGFAVGRTMSAHRIVDLTIEDVQGEVLAAIVQRRRRQVGTPEMSDEEPAVIPEDSSERAWANTVAKSVAARLLTRTVNSADWAALSEFKARVAQFQTDNGREMSSREKDALADEIRMSRPPRRRPSSDFHRIADRFAASLDAPRLRHNERSGMGPSYADLVADGSDTGTSALLAYEQSVDPSTREFTEGSYGDQAFSMLDEGVHRDHGPSRLAYLALAERRGAPMPAQLSIREDQATAAKRAMHAAGGPAEVARRVSQGCATTKETSLLMAAFPKTEHARAAEFADVLLAYPEFAGDLWAGTIQYGTIRSPRARLNKRTAPNEGAVAL